MRQELSQARISHLAEMDQQKGVAAEQIERLNENLATTRARLESATEQAEERQIALGESQAKLAQAQAQGEAANEELGRVRAALDVKQQQAEGLQLQVATVGAQHAELQRSHTALQADAEKWRQVADESSRELAKTAGGLQEVQRQNSELMTRLSPTKARQSGTAAKPSAGKSDD